MRNALHDGRVTVGVIELLDFMFEGFGFYFVFVVHFFHSVSLLAYQPFS